MLNPYDLRHTAAGLSAERLADLLGDKDTRMVSAITGIRSHRRRDSARVPRHARGHWFKSSRATKRNLRDCGGISLTLDNLNHYAEEGLTSADILDRRAK